MLNKPPVKAKPSINSIILALNLVGLDGKNILAEVLLISTYYSLIRNINNNNLCSRYDFISTLTKCLKGFSDGLFILNLVSAEIDIKPIVGALLHQLTVFRIVESHTTTSGIKSQTSLQLNLKTNTLPILYRCDLRLTPGKVILYNGKTFLLNLHLILIKCIVKRNKHSVYCSTYSNVCEINHILATPHSVDLNLLIKLRLAYAQQHNIPLMLVENLGAAREELNKAYTILAEKNKKPYTNDPLKKKTIEEAAAHRLMVVQLFEFQEEVEIKKNLFYLDVFYDFRGRLYYVSQVGPTTNKIARLAYTKAPYTQNDKNQCTLPTQKQIMLLHTVYPDTNQLTNFQLTALIRILYEIGKLFKTSELCPIPFDRFIEIGAQKFFEEPTQKNVYEFITLKTA